ncbi:hypothetical protein D9757_004804 [Collybiopsis confluens]|uniref:Uncharacterized protein n=1 Tax=Collybiopsis confluens TaxID=2823264 RepID=A0A8H5HT54_9AGAR|nr:hypothetical protein D9757_004804 [Collybiopsis confluens]
MSSTTNASLVGSVFERKPAALKPTESRFSSSLNSKTGFPPVQHRSQKSSTFLKTREENKKKAELPSQRPVDVPPIVHDSSTAGPGPKTLENQNRKESGDDWRTQISAENEAKVEAMTGDEREAEIREVLERFGPSVGEILRRAREKREARKENKIPLEEVPLTSEREPWTPPTGSSAPLISSLSGSPSRAGTRPNSPSKLPRKLRFAELAPDQVHVYPSAPSSPKKQVLALPPPDPDGGAVSLGYFNGRFTPATGVEASQAHKLEDGEPEEGTPEYIRRNYFPSAPTDNPDLAWISSSPQPPRDQSSDLRFDLTGSPIPPSKTLTLPTHLGLHHHAEGSRAGYTLDDIFLLTRSTVRAQRVAMLDVLAGVVRWLRAENPNQDAEIELARKALLSPSDSQTSQAPTAMKRMLFSGLEALPERGLIGVRAMDVVWECVVGRTKNSEDLGDLELELGGMERETAAVNSDLITALPLKDVLPQLTLLLLSPPDRDGGDISHDASSKSGSTATTTQHQILSILTQVARYSNTNAEIIVKERALVDGVLKVFMTPSSAAAAIHLLSILASASRTNAEALCEEIRAGDALLRFVVLSPDDVTLVEIMLFYTVLARYGMYSRVATDANEAWWQIGDRISALGSSRTPSDLRCVRVYAALIESWLVCATDPHRTTPGHELLWSQVKGWEWGASLTSLLLKSLNHKGGKVVEAGDHSMTSVPELSTFNSDHLSSVAAIWRSLGAYLEGAKVNGKRGGEDERTEISLVLKRVFDSDMLRILSEVVQRLKQDLTVAQSELVMKEIALFATTLYSAIRLWLGCYPPGSKGSTPPFELPFDAVSELCASLVGHDLWRSDIPSLFMRPVTTLLNFFLRLSPHLPGSHSDIWLAQTFGVLRTFQRGDEEYAHQVIPQILTHLTPEWAAQRGSVGAPSHVWEEKDGLKGALGPFFTYEINPARDTYAYIAPLCSSPRSIGICTTLRVPFSTSRPAISTSRPANTEWRPLGLPLHSDWTLSPITHLLRSGSDHSIFKQSGALPDAWDASETEVVRATLALTRAQREILTRFASSLMPVIGAKQEDIVLGCMEVFMLEHGVGTGSVKAASENERSLQEVFRDAVVGRQMHELLDPFTLKNSPFQSLPYSPRSPRPVPAPLEAAGLPLLGTSVPFYQFYTDFVSLYDSVSFSHPLFSRLLFPPTSMLYASDYRKLLWTDYSHLLRGVRLEVGDMIVSHDGIIEWMYPAETDPEILSAYLRALINYGGALQGFVRLVAVHHIATNIWSDLSLEGCAEEERGSRLLKVVLDQGGTDVVREVLRYRQLPHEEFWLPPRCYEETDESCARGRCELIEKWGGKDLLEKVKGVYY